MPKERLSAEQIETLLRQIGGAMAQGNQGDCGGKLRQP
jgi:hypothetical protein